MISIATPEFSIVKKGRQFVVLCDGKEDVRIMPCQNLQEAENQLMKMINRIRHTSQEWFNLEWTYTIPAKGKSAETRRIQTCNS